MFLCLSHGEGWMPLHDSVGKTVKRAQLLRIKAQMLSIWAEGYLLMIVCVCVI